MRMDTKYSRSGFKMSQFILKIDLGNDAMQTPYHIQEALRGVSKTIYNADFNMDDMEKGCKIFDSTGNVVGSYLVVE